MSQPTQLIFIYNANSGLLNGMLDSAHKALSPDTYQCALCDITHGYFGEKKAWTAFREQFQGDMKFLHKDETDWQGQLPVILLDDGQSQTVLADTAALQQLKSTDQLIAYIDKHTSQSS